MRFPGTFLFKDRNKEETVTKKIMGALAFALALIIVGGGRRFPAGANPGALLASPARTRGSRSTMPSRLPGPGEGKVPMVIRQMKPVLSVHRGTISILRTVSNWTGTLRRGCVAAACSRALLSSVPGVNPVKFKGTICRGHGKWQIKGTGKRSAILTPARQRHLAGCPDLTLPPTAPVSRQHR